MSRFALIPKFLRLSLKAGVRTFQNGVSVPASQPRFQRLHSATASFQALASEAASAKEQSSTEASLQVADLSLCPLLKDSLQKRGISSLFSIQAECFNHIVEGKDLVGRARTGTGKTLAFSLPVIERLQREPARDRIRPRVLILAPTRELASQVQSEISQLTGTAFRSVCLYGGSAYRPQESALYRGVDIVVGTPGRVQDMITRGVLRLGNIHTIILDEADHMLDIGFARDLEKIIGELREAKSREALQYKAKEDFQFLLFSATVPGWIKQAIRKYLKPDYLYIDHVGTEEVKCSTTVTQLSIPTLPDQVASTVSGLLQTHRSANGRCIVFCETKYRCDDLAEELSQIPNVHAVALHGDIRQAARERALSQFRAGKLSCLVATDVAARGLDIPNVELVIQTEPPRNTETFIHRSGRTGRAGKAGTNVILCPPARQSELDDIARGAGVNFKVTPAPAVYSHIIGDNNASNLAAAFAQCGKLTGGAKPRSLIDCFECMVTLEMQGSSRAEDLTNYLYNKLKLEPININPRHITSFRSGKGLVFDVHEDVVASILSAQARLDAGEIPYSISVCTLLPPIVRASDGFKANSRNKSPSRSNSGWGNRYGRPSGSFKSKKPDSFSRWGQRNDDSRGSGYGSRGGFGSRDSGSGSQYGSNPLKGFKC